jgi:uncharacterized damage-inducible protein DinB
MDSVFAVRRMHEHRVWADRLIFEAASKLAEEGLHREFPIGQGSVWKSLCHMWGAETVWIGAVEGDESCVPPGDDPTKIPGNQLGLDGMKSLSELGSRWEELHGRWGNWLGNLTAEQLEKPVWRKSYLFNPPKRVQTGCYDVHLHVCLHAHWTAAQVVNMLRSLGVQPLPNVMHISMARQQLGQ